MLSILKVVEFSGKLENFHRYDHIQNEMVDRLSVDKANQSKLTSCHLHGRRRLNIFHRNSHDEIHKHHQYHRRFLEIIIHIVDVTILFPAAKSVSCQTTFLLTTAFNFQPTTFSDLVTALMKILFVFLYKRVILFGFYPTKCRLSKHPIDERHLEPLHSSPQQFTI